MAWIYLLFFLVIPLSRILPRLIRKWKEKNRVAPEQFTQDPYQSTNETITESSRKTDREDIPREMKPQTLDMLVLGELNRGIKNFNSIQKNLGIDRYFDAIVTVDDVSRGKPSPEIVLKACDFLKVNPKDVLLIGDTDSDVKAGKTAGCTVVGVKIDADYTINSLSELTDILVY